MKLLIGILLIGIFSAADGSCPRSCGRALASYYLQQGSDMTNVSTRFAATIPEILRYNPQIRNPDSVQAGDRVNVPFPCECLADELLGHEFNFTTFPGVTYDLIAKNYYANLTTAESLQQSNPAIPATNIPDTGVILKVRVNCSCGNSSVSKDYGLFVTYPLRDGETLESVARMSNVSANLLRGYNPTSNFNSGSGIVYIPGRGLPRQRFHQLVSEQSLSNIHTSAKMVSNKKQFKDMKTSINRLSNIVHCYCCRWGITRMPMVMAASAGEE